MRVKTFVRNISYIIIFVMLGSFCLMMMECRTVFGEEKMLKAPEHFCLTAKDKNSIELKWHPVSDANGYVIYRYDKKSKKYKKVKTIKRSKTSSITIKKIKSNVTEKFKMRAYTIKKGGKIYSKYTYVVKGCTKGKKKNVSKLTIKTKSYTVEQGKQIQLKVKTVPQKGILSEKIVWKSENSRIAKVSSTGKVTAVSSGTTYIIARAHSGKSVKIKLTSKSKYAQEIPVLTFHRLVSEEVKQNDFPDNQWVASIEDFKRQMKYLYENGYKTLSMDEFYNWHKGKVNYPPKTVVITFDDGDYELYYLGLTVLKQYGFKATAFVVGSRIQEVTPDYENSSRRCFLGQDLIDKIKSEYPKLEIQSHSYNLHYYQNSNPVVMEKTLSEIREDFGKNKQWNFKYMAYPYGVCSDSFITAFQESGYKLAFGFGKYRKARRTDLAHNIYRVKINGQIDFETYKNWLKVQ